MKILVDTNVILDIFLQREPFFKTSLNSLQKAIALDFDCFISVSAATDIYYVLRKSLKSKEQAKYCISKITNLAKFCDVMSSDINSALLSEISDFEDAVVDSIAIRNDMDFIITRNVKDFEQSETPVLTPTEFLSRF